MPAVIRQFYDGLRACGWMMSSARICSTWNSVFVKGCVLAPLLVNMFFTAALRVPDKRFIADAAIMDSMVRVQRKKGEKNSGKARAGKSTGRGGRKRRPIRCGK